jgi:hypothetical protein
LRVSSGRQEDHGNVDARDDDERAAPTGFTPAVPASADRPPVHRVICRALGPWGENCVMLSVFPTLDTHLMSAFLAFLDRRFERLFHLLEKGTLDKRRRFETDR